MKNHDTIPPELVKTFYAKTMEYAKRGLGPSSIARALSEGLSLRVTPETIRHWIVGDRNPLRRNVFVIGPSPALSYVIGANIGDGCTVTKTWCVKLEVADLDFAQAFNSNMATLFSRTKPNKILIRRFQVERLPLYMARYCSKQLAKLLQSPQGKLVEIACAFPREFLRGFFDAEGHVDIAVGKHFQLHMGIENSDKALLFRIKQLLKKALGINSKINRKRKAGSVKKIRNQEFVMRRTSFSLLIRRIDDIRRFKAEIGFSISRKTQKLEDALSAYAIRGAESRFAMWEHLYLKTRGEWVKRAPSIQVDERY